MPLTALPGSPTTPEVWPPADYAPIGDDVMPPGRTPFTAARLNHRWSGYIGTRERAVMDKTACDELLTDPYIQSNPNLIGLVHLMHSGSPSNRGYHDPWDVVISRLGKTATEASPYMEYILAGLDIGVGYARCDHGRLTSDVVWGHQARRMDDGDDTDPHRPCEWIVGLTDELHAAIVADAKVRIAEQAARSRARRAHIGEMKRRMSLQLQEVLRQAEDMMKDPVQLAAYLRQRDVELPDDDHLPPLSVLQAKYRELDEQERRATYAPMPRDDMVEAV